MQRILQTSAESALSSSSDFADPATRFASGRPRFLSEFRLARITGDGPFGPCYDAVLDNLPFAVERFCKQKGNNGLLHASAKESLSSDAEHLVHDKLVDHLETLKATLAQKQLSARNLVRYYCTVVDDLPDGLAPAMVFEPCDGDLATLLATLHKTGRVLEDDELLIIACWLLSGLATMQKCGFTCRELTLRTAQFCWVAEGVEFLVRIGGTPGCANDTSDKKLDTAARSVALIVAQLMLGVDVEREFPDVERRAAAIEKHCSVLPLEGITMRHRTHGFVLRALAGESTLRTATSALDHCKFLLEGWTLAAPLLNLHQLSLQGVCLDRSLKAMLVAAAIPDFRPSDISIVDLEPGTRIPVRYRGTRERCLAICDHIAGQLVDGQSPLRRHPLGRYLALCFPDEQEPLASGLYLSNCLPAFLGPAFPGALCRLVAQYCTGPCAARRDVAATVSCALETLLNSESKVEPQLPRDPKAITVFHSHTLPEWTISAYFDRLVTYVDCSPESIVGAMALLGRVFSEHPELRRDRLVMHRLLLTALCCAAKITDDPVMSNAYWARIGGTTARELNSLELAFVKLLDCNLFISRQTYTATLHALCDAKLHSGCDRKCRARKIWYSQLVGSGLPALWDSPSDASMFECKTTAVESVLEDKKATLPPSRQKTRDPIVSEGYEQYQKLEKMGSGTAGLDYKCRHKQTGMLVLMKRVRLDNEDEGLPSDVLRDIALTKHLGAHSSILRMDAVLFRAGISAGRVYEFIEHDLTALIDLGDKGLDLHTVKSLLYQLLTALAYCHGQQIMHRNLQPAALQITKKFELKLTEFGFARDFVCVQSHPLSHLHVFVGVPAVFTNEVVVLWYRPPDVLLGSKAYSSEIDMWGVGCLFAEMCTGRPLFIGSSTADQLTKIFEVLGTPAPDEWPGLIELPEWKTASQVTYSPVSLETRVPQLDKLGINLLEKLLRMRPADRISARDALNHPYFADVKVPL